MSIFAIPRRALLLLLATAFVWRPARAESDAVQAEAFIKQAGKELADLVGGARTVVEKRSRLQPFIDRVVDVDAVARFCLGRHWAEATPSQQQDYVRLFHAVLLNNVVVHMGDYQQTEVHVTVGPPEPREDGVHVPTLVERSGNPPANVTWVVREGPGGPRIVDLVAEGTSLRLTVRSDYNAFLVRHGNSIEALIDALRQQNAQLAGGPG